MDDQTLIIAIACAAAIFGVISVVLFLKWRSADRARIDQERRALEIEERYRPITDLEKSVAETKSRLAEFEGALRSEKSNAERMIAELRADYATKKATYDRLTHEIAALEDRIDFAELGLYQPVFSFDDSAQYAAAIEGNVGKQKNMVAEGKAVATETKWTVDGSEAKGRTLIKRATRLTLRAFNNECEVIIAKTSWKNVQQMADRIRKLKDTLDKLNESNHLRISQAYLDLKLEELSLVHEERLKRHEEQEKLREEREKAREDAKAQRELEAEVRRATLKEDQRREALMEARAELRAAGEAEKAALETKISDLETKLAAAHAATERAMSMAQQTKAGHVYVISNVGAFGENVFKIGMTRRLEPRDRIRELGDASVPFPFDIHALIFTEDAPALERSLQIELEAHRVNMVNPRREFFRVPPTELRSKVLARFPDAIYLDRPEAQEYLQSLPKVEVSKIAANELKDALPATI